MWWKCGEHTLARRVIYGWEMDNVGGTSGATPL